MDVDSAMSSQEQRLMGQAANNLQQRDAALSALHRVEDEVLHLKTTVAVSLVLYIHLLVDKPVCIHTTRLVMHMKVQAMPWYPRLHTVSF